MKVFKAVLRMKGIQKETLHFVVGVFYKMEDMHTFSYEQKRMNEEIALVLDILIHIYGQEQ